ncbi:MAG: geranylgeranylglyceryl/heptaprenylglyceryl phosphate synthase [Candidatus Bathyarchaeota archaeon]|nr:geranylgeranylglyceryl/heptaprenylglyceryl phosphate synthase [Candidatus Bathyarchaeota archaeon]
MKSVEKYLLQTIRRKGSIHLSLLDPDRILPSEAAQTSKALEAAGTTGIMIGGSTVVSVPQLDEVVKAVKDEVKVPVILFPNNITGISQFADAIWFMSLLNSDNPLFITGLQALGAPLIKRFGLETLSLGYIIVDAGSTAAYIGQARALPRDKPEIVASYTLAAQYLGLHFVYLEAGSGAREPVPLKMISEVKNTIDIPLVVGGGIRTRFEAEAVVKAGADIVVTGTIIEESGLTGEMVEIIKGILKMGQKKINRLK